MLNVFVLICVTKCLSKLNNVDVRINTVTISSFILGLFGYWVDSIANPKMFLTLGHYFDMNDRNVCARDVL